MSRRVKVWGAVAAFVAAPLLFLAALAIESPWVFLAVGIGIWALAGVGLALVWSATRPEPVRDWDLDLDGMPGGDPACGYPISHPAHPFAHPDEDVDGGFGPARDCAGVPGDWTQPMDRDVTS